MSDIWAENSAASVFAAISRVCDQKGGAAMVLTGGHSASRLYTALAQIPDYFTKRLTIFLSDERCVPHSHSDSNYGMLLRTLYKQGIPDLHDVNPINGTIEDKNHEVERYGNMIPPHIDILLLGIAADGHVASIFPDTKGQINEKGALCFVKHGRFHDRFTMVPQTLARAGLIFMLAPSEEKRKTLKKFAETPLATNPTPLTRLMMANNGFEGRGKIAVL